MGMEILRELNLLSITIRVLLAILIGGMLGIERGRKRHPAGFRTYILVCIGAAMVMMTNQYIVMQYGGGDPARLGAQVVSGIGFLGAGTIIVTRRSQIKGLTTAAGLWAAACLGLAIGIGFYEGAIVVSIVILLVMTVFRRFDDWVTSNDRYLHIYGNFESARSLHYFIDKCKELEIRVQDMEFSKSKLPEEEGVFAVFTLRLSKKRSHDLLIEELEELDGVRYIDEI